MKNKNEKKDAAGAVGVLKLHWKKVLIGALLLAAAGAAVVLGVWLWPSGDQGLAGGDEPLPEDAGEEAALPSVPENEIGPDEVVFFINGEPITMSVFGYHLYDTFMRLESMHMTNELNFWLDLGDGMSLGNYAIANAIDSVKFGMAVEKLAGEHNIDRAEAEAMVDEYLEGTVEESFAGDAEAFGVQLALMGTTPGAFRDILISQRLGSEIFEMLYGEGGSAAIDPADHYDEFVTVSIILLMTISETPDEETGEMLPLGDVAIAQKRALAELILERLDEGEDFFALLDQFGEDQGLFPEHNPDQSYTFQGHEMPFDLSVAAFSLEEGEHSGIVETPYGFCIVKRLPIDEQWVAYVVA